jgi:hypothetical protein
LKKNVLIAKTLSPPPSPSPVKGEGNIGFPDGNWIRVPSPEG